MRGAALAAAFGRPWRRSVARLRIRQQAWAMIAVVPVVAPAPAAARAGCWAGTSREPWFAVMLVPVGLPQRRGGRHGQGGQQPTVQISKPWQVWWSSVVPF